MTTDENAIRSRRRLMTNTEAAAYLDKAPKTLAMWRYLGVGPAFTKLGRTVHYDRDTVDSWIAERSGFRSTAHAKARLALAKKHVMTTAELVANPIADEEDRA